MITIFGSTNLDQIGTVSRLPRPGETVAGGTFSVSPGGKGANQALAARRAGAEVRHVSAVGNDVFAEAALALLRADGVDLGQVRVANEPTGIAMIFVDQAGENAIAVLPGANGTLSPADAEASLAHLETGSVLLLQQEIPQEATVRALELARARGAISILNTAPFLPSTAAIVPQASIVVANESEFALLCGAPETDIVVAMQDWARRHGQIVIVTLGGAGARAATPDAVISVPALPITPLDTVGAGDTFCGYLAAGLDAGLPLEAAVRRATVAASLACLKPGAQPAIPRAAELEPYLQ